MKGDNACFGHLCVCAFTHTYIHTCTHMFQICLLISHSGTATMSVIFLLAHTSFSSSLLFVPNKDFITVDGISRWHCVFTPDAQKRVKSNNITAMFSPFLLGWTSTWHMCTCELLYGPDSHHSFVSPKLLWCFLEESVCVSHVCFHLLVSAQTKMTHAIFLWCNTQIQWDVESWGFNLDIYFTHRAQWASEHRFFTVATPMQHFHKL